MDTATGSTIWRSTGLRAHESPCTVLSKSRRENISVSTVNTKIHSNENTVVIKLTLKVTWRTEGRKSDPNAELAAAAAAFSSCAALRLAINLAVDDVGWKILNL